MRARILITTIALTTLAATALSAQPGRGPHRGPQGDLWQSLASDFDLNQDGEITADEFTGAATFERLDRNGDGVLTEDDFAGRGGPPRFRMRGPGGRGPGLGPGAGLAGGLLLRFADADDNREVTSIEWQAFVDGFDADGNGEIGADEWIATVHPPDREPRPDHFEMIVQSLDRDGNGVFDTTDLTAVFDELDADGDGVVTGDELPHRRFRRRG